MGLTANVCDDTLKFEGIGSFEKPSPSDVIGCSTGPFASNAGALGPLTAHLFASLNRSTILSNKVYPNNNKVSEYHKLKVTNNYARLIREANIDGRGYTFPYDDVPVPGGIDQSGFVNGFPKLYVVTIR